MSEKKEKSLIIVVSAPSGSGKTTIVEEVLKQMEGLRRSISFTTRPPREGEKNGRDYIFISEEEFKKRIDEGDFLEWEKNFGNYYGTSAEQLTKAQRQGDDIILSIDVRGGSSVKDKFPESISIFIVPPSEEVLASRLRKRKTDDPAEIDRRLAEAKRELDSSSEYDYLVVNDKLDEAVEEVRQIITSARISSSSNK